MFDFLSYYAGDSTGEAPTNMDKTQSNIDSSGGVSMQQHRNLNIKTVFFFLERREIT